MLASLAARSARHNARKSNGASNFLWLPKVQMLQLLNQLLLRARPHVHQNLCITHHSSLRLQQLLSYLGSHGKNRNNLQGRIKRQATRRLCRDKGGVGTSVSGLLKCSKTAHPNAR